MKKIIISIVASLLIGCFNADAHSMNRKPEVNECMETNQKKVKLPNQVHSLKGKVKEIVETTTFKGIAAKNIFRLNENQQVTYVLLTSFNNNVSQEVSFEYNELGLITRKAMSSSTKKEGVVGYENELYMHSLFEQPFDGRLEIYTSPDKEIVTYTYNAQGKLKQEVTTNTRGVYTHILNAKGEVQKSISVEGGHTYVSKYDSNGTKISETKDGKPIEFYNYDDDDPGCAPDGELKERHDTKGRLIYYSDGSSEERYTYNINGYLATNKGSDHWWGDHSITYTGYVYDVNKNWTKRTIKWVGEYYPSGVTVTFNRQYIYY